MTAEEQAEAKLAELRNRIALLESEIRIAEGRSQLASPALVQAARTETSRLKERCRELVRALWVVLRDGQLVRDEEEARIRSESLRQTAIDYFAKLNLNADLWKNIAS
jgi:hypothetical protein